MYNIVTAKKSVENVYLVLLVLILAMIDILLKVTTLSVVFWNSYFYYFKFIVIFYILIT